MKQLLKLVPFLMVFGFSLSASAEKTFSYDVGAKGETCEEIATAVYGDAGRIDLLHKYNDLDNKCWLGDGKSKKLDAGTKLKLPEPPPAGLISNKAGSVNSKAPTSDWSPAQLGSELYRLWRVNTLDESRAEVTFRDRSRLDMRENTLILIYGATRDKARSTPSRASLEKGALRSRMDELAGGGVIIETPSSVAQIESRASLISVAAGGVTRIANHGEGTVGVSGHDPKKPKKKKKKRKSVTVKTGMGTKVEKGKEPEKPRPLPPTPQWKSSPDLFVTIEKAPTTIFAEWDSVSEADSYYVEFSKDELAAEVIESVVVPKGILKLKVENLPPGDYYASVASIDSDQFESIPTGPRRIRVREIALQGEVFSTDPIQVALGSAFIVPNDVSCGVGVEQPTRRPIMTVIGQHTMSCVDSNSQIIGEFAVEGIAPKISFSSDTMSDDGVVFVDRRGTVDVVFDPIAPQSVNVVSNAVSLSDPIRIDAKTFRYVLTSIEGVDSGPVGFSVGDVELATVDVKNGASPEKVRWRFGTGLSLSAPVAESRFENSVGPWTMLRLMVGIVPNDRVSLEFDLGLGALDFDHGAVGALDYNLIGRVNLLTGLFRPFLSASIGAQTNFDQSDTIPLVRAGIGATARLGDRMGLRLDLDAAIAQGIPTKVALLPRGLLSLFWEF